MERTDTLPKLHSLILRLFPNVWQKVHRAFKFALNTLPGYRDKKNYFKTERH